MKNENQIHYERAEDLKRLSFIEQFLKRNENKQLNVLDVGCGNGNISRFIGSFGHQVLGIDISDTTIEKARELTNMPNVQFRNVSAEDLMSKEKYDVIVCSEVIEHLSLPSGVVVALAGLLKPYGTLIVTVPNGFGPREVLMTKPLQWFRDKTPSLYNGIKVVKGWMGYTGATVQSDAENLTHLQFFSKSALCKLVGGNGFRLVGFGTSNFMEGVFPFSLLTKRVKALQSFDCWLADQLPDQMASGFMTAWQLK